MHLRKLTTDSLNMKQYAARGAVAQQHVVGKHSNLSRPRVLFSGDICSSGMPGKGVFQLIYCSGTSFDL